MAGLGYEIAVLWVLACRVCALAFVVHATCRSSTGAGADQTDQTYRHTRKGRGAELSTNIHVSPHHVKRKDAQRATGLPTAGLANKHRIGSSGLDIRCLLRRDEELDYAQGRPLMV